jgi:hypothetical protein
MQPMQWSQNQLKAWLQETAARYEPGQWLNPGDRATYEQILERHPNAQDKRGPGIEGVRVVKNLYGYKAFTIVRVDGTEAVAGQRALLCKRLKSLQDKLMGACRDAARPSTLDFRNDHLDDNCELCGGSHNMHVDHAPPWTFQRIFRAWCAEFNITEESLIEDVFDDDRVHAQVRFADSAVAAHFLAYHDDKAMLRMLCQACNLKQLPS